VTGFQGPNQSLAHDSIPAEPFLQANPTQLKKPWLAQHTPVLSRRPTTKPLSEISSHTSLLALVGPVQLDSVKALHFIACRVRVSRISRSCCPALPASCIVPSPVANASTPTPSARAKPRLQQRRRPDVRLTLVQPFRLLSNPPSSLLHRQEGAVVRRGLRLARSTSKQSHDAVVVHPPGP